MVSQVIEANIRCKHHYCQLHGTLTKNKKPGVKTNIYLKAGGKSIKFKSTGNSEILKEHTSFGKSVFHL